MESQTLYRKYRPQTFGDLVGQEHVSRSLLNSLGAGKVSHAYLFCGPRGTGKTSTARILAKAVNCTGNDGKGEPCNVCPSCLNITRGSSLDLIEMDAASNRGIDEIRDLRDKVNFQPNEARYKFYIIDEVHMLTTPAFNALLKTLEEPPAHAMFVLATTEGHSVPATIRSRCQRYDFRLIPLPEMMRIMRTVCGQEGLELEDGALELLARTATGSLRDAWSLLDQAVAYTGGRVELGAVRELLGLSENEAVRQLVRAAIGKQVDAGVRVINQAVEQGADMKQFNAQVVARLRNLLVLRSGGEKALSDLTPGELEELRQEAEGIALPALLNLAEAFAGVTFSARAQLPPQMPLEMAFLNAVLESDKPVAVAPPAAAAPTPRPSFPPRQTERPTPVYKAPTSAPPPPREASTPKAPEPAAAPAAGPESAGGTSASLYGMWAALPARVKGKSIRAYGMLSSCAPRRLDGDRLVLACESPFHKGQLDTPAVAAAVCDEIAALMGKRYRLECEVVSVAEFRELKQAASAGATALVEQDPVIKRAMEKHGARLRNGAGPDEDAPAGS